MHPPKPMMLTPPCLFPHPPRRRDGGHLPIETHCADAAVSTSPIRRSRSAAAAGSAQNPKYQNAAAAPLPEIRRKPGPGGHPSAGPQ